MAKKKKVDTKHLFHAVCILSVIPIRSKANLDEPLLTQMLFGETCFILEKKNKYWYKIVTTLDQITGWVVTSHISLISEKECLLYNDNHAYALEICHPIFNDEVSKFVLIGSSLPMYDGISATLPDGKYVYNGQATKLNSSDYTPEILNKIAKRYLYSPEMRGGRSPFGIESAAFVQLVFRFFSIPLPRLSHQQYLMGEIVDFIETAVEGDLVFCQDDTGSINHVGIIIGEKKVIHVSGCVRIDKIDHHGIFNHDLHKYTHKVRIVKRVI